MIEIQDKSIFLSQELNFPVKVYWCDQNKHYIIHNAKTNQEIFQFETGQPIDTSRVRKHIWKAIKTGEMYNEDIQQNKYEVEKARERKKENRREMAKHLAKELCETSGDFWRKKTFVMGDKK